MPILVTCSRCQHSLQVRDDLAGKRGKCPNCQAVLVVPGADGAPRTQPAGAAPSSAAAVGATPPSAAGTRTSAGAPAIAWEQLTPEQLRSLVMGGFRGTFERVPVTALYQLGIVFTALYMVLLPLVYGLLIVLVLAGAWWHLSTNFGMMNGVRGRGVVIVFLAYLAPAVVGGIMAIFMIKPFFARAADDGRTRSFTPQAEPLLFEFVNRVCALVGAPAPKRIDVDCDINASAGLRSGWWSLLSGRDLVLRIGMPLAAGLTLRQFAGVLAHEFGHFSQSFGMRLTYVIRSINFWLMRVVYERDAWDVWLAETARSLDLRIGWVLYLAMAGVWLSRKILWVLMYAGHIVAGFMLREMEFDADRYEARLAGSDTFAATARRLVLLHFAWRGAQADLGSFYREGRLADNLPLLLMANLEQLPSAAHAAVEKHIAESTTGLFDSHPADRDRIASAQAEQAPGVFVSDLPARVLFAHFDATTHNVTEDYYRDLFGPQFKPQAMHATAGLLAKSAGEQTAAEARERLFGGGFSALRPLRLPSQYDAARQSPNQWKEELLAARAELGRLAPGASGLVDELDQADTRLVEASQARAVLACGARLEDDSLKRQYRSDTQAMQAKRDAQLAIQRLGARLEPLETAAGKRLAAAVLLMGHPAIAQRVTDAARLKGEAETLTPLAHQLANLHGAVLELRNLTAIMAALLGHLEGNRNTDLLVREIVTSRDRILGQLTDMKRHFAGATYPFDHAQGPLSLSEYLVPCLPPSDEIGEIFGAAQDAVRKTLELHARITSRLCTVAEAVEAAFGLQPLPAPPQEGGSGRNA